MIRTINITGRTGRIDVPSFLWTENESLTLKFVTREIRIGRYVCEVKLGEKTKTVYLGNDMSVEFSPEWLKDGAGKLMEIYLEFRTPDASRVIIPSAKSETDCTGFLIEPLLIEKMDDSYSISGWLSKIENELAGVKAELLEVQEKLAVYEENGTPWLVETELEETNTQNEEDKIEGENENV